VSNLDGVGLTATRPSTAVQRRPVFRRRDWFLFAVFGALNLAAVALVAVRVLGLRHRLDPGSVVVLVPGVIGLLGFEARWFTLPLMRRPCPMSPEPGLRVAVVTTIVPSCEPLAMLRRSVRAMAALRYEHDTWVLDEGDDPEVRALCEELGVHYFTRAGIERYQQPSGPFAACTKYGNYNSWLDAHGYAGYEVVVGFDPDHIPKPEFLERTLGYLRDEAIGYVQAAQLYYNQPAGLVARGAAEETYTYYSSIQMTSYALGYPIVTGCHTVQRTSALRDVGGYADHEADDLLVTVRFRAAGWEGVYVPERLAAGITPTDWGGYLGQQRRWARSVLDVKLRELPKLAGALPRRERVVSALHGLTYLYGLSTACSIGVLAVALVSGWQPAVVTGEVLSATALLSGVLTAGELFRQRFYLDRRREWGLHLRGGLLRYAKWPYILLALFDSLRQRERGYLTTAKVAMPVRRLLVVPHGATFGVVAASGAIGRMLGRPVSGLMEAWALVVMGLSALVIAVEQVPPPVPYDDDLAAARVPWSRPEA
jgi:cellulose synthase (UDP-forming)